LNLILAAHQSRVLVLQEFANALTKLGVNCIVVKDNEVYDGFPSRNFRNWFQSRAKLKNLINSFKPDVVFLDRPRHFGIGSIKEKIPVYMFLKGDFWTELKLAEQTLYKSPHRRLALWQWNRIAKTIFKNSKMILPVCKYLDNIVRIQYPNKKTSVLNQGINLSQWFAESGMSLKHPCVGLLQGAVIWGKVTEMMLLPKVLKSLPDVMFYWAGDGPFRDIVLSKLQKYDNFKWLGPLNYPHEVRKFLTEIDVYAIFSGMDMLPRTLQEAQCMNKPVVASNVGGIPELIRINESGFLVKKSDFQDWIDKLSFLLDNEHKRKQMGNNGRKFMEQNFSWEKTAKDFVNILNLQNNEFT